MAILAGTAFVDILPNMKKFGAALTTGINAQQQEMAKKAGRIGLVMGAGLAFGAKKAIDSAKDLNEAVSAVTVTFGTSSQQVLDWSKNTNDAFSQLQFNSAIKGFAVFARSAGLGDDATAKFSKQLLDAAGDLASFHNADPSEVLDNIKSGLTGETEPLRKYGILLNQAQVDQEAVTMGLVNQGEKLTEQQKILARQHLILKMLGPATGDWARTIESAANQERLLAANTADNTAALGQGLLPAYTQLIKILQAVVTFFGKHVGLTKVLAIAFTALTAALLIYSATVKIAAAAQAVFNTVTKATNATLVANPIGLVVVAIVALVAILVIAYKKSDTFRRVVNGAFEAVVKVVGRALQIITFQLKMWLKGLSLLASAATHIPLIGDKFKGVSGKIDSAVRTMDKITGAMVKFNIESDKTGKSLDKAAGSTNKLSQSTDTLNKAIASSTSNLTKMGAAVDTAFEGFQTGALQAFDAETARVLDNLSVSVSALGRSWVMKPGDLTPAERELAAMEKAEALRDRNLRKQKLLDELKDAQGKKFQDIETGGKIITVRQAPDVDRIKEIQAELRDIEQEGVKERLTARAEKEREAAESATEMAQKNYQAQRDQQKKHLEKELTALREAIKKGELTQKQARDRALATLAKYGISLEKAGKDLGEAFATGLNEAMKSVEAQAGKVRGLMQKIIDLRQQLQNGKKVPVPVVLVEVTKRTNVDAHDRQKGGSVVGQYVEHQTVLDDETARRVGNAAAKKATRAAVNP